MGIDYQKSTVYAMLERSAQRWPKATAYRFMGKKTSYLQLLERIGHIASALHALGIGPGDRVSVCMPNMPQAVDCFYALNRLGAVANMVHPLCAAQELRFYLELTKSKAVLTLDSFYEKVASVASDAVILTARVKPELPLHKRLFYKEKPLPGGVDFQQLYRTPVGLPPAPADSSACACILYSGGTTGKPKGVCLSSDNLNAAALQTLRASGYEDFAGLKMLSAMPLFHGFGLGVGIHTPLIAGASCLLVPRFERKSFFQLLKRQRPHFLPGVPSLFEAMVQAPEMKGVSLDFCKGVFCGGDILPPTLKERVDAFLKEHGCHVQLREGYGMTECVSVAALTPDHAGKSGTVGLPLAHMRFQVVTPGTVDPVATGQVGEICISGPTVMLGYLDDPSETAMALQTHADGALWLHTGDLGSLDDQGYLCFHGRLKRMIVTNGYNVYPAQLEKVLLQHPGVKECCVLGVADGQRGQRVRAFAVAEDSVTQQQLLSHCSRYIARYAMPREIVFCKELPKTPLGKVDYQKLEAL